RARQSIRRDRPRDRAPMRLRLPRTTTYDVPLVVVVLMLLLLGLAMVYSASGITALDANDDPSTYLAQQSAWAVLGLAALVVAAPGLGTAVVVVAVALAMYFVAGARLREFGALGALAVVAALALAVVQPYRYARLTVFIDPWSDPQKYGFQTIQMLYGLALGGPFGEGLGAGKEKFGYLPHPYTDSIFAVLGDELGLAGALVIVLLFLALAFRRGCLALRAA